ncbi:MAG: outer membrane beta-barrel protein [Pseudomonadota bacterium]
MKQILSVCAVVAATFAAAPAFAQGYIGFGVGSAKLTGVDGTQGIAPSSLTGGNTSRSLVKLYGGYQFTPNWGVEAQYSDLGSRDLTLRNGAGAVTATGSYKNSQFSVAGTGTLPLSSSFSLLGKLGVTANNNRLSVVGVTDRGNTTSLMLGVGVAYNFTPALSARLEYEDFGTVAKDAPGGSVRANAYSLSLKYAF